MAMAKGYRGVGMEGPIASWYAKNTGRDLSRFTNIARRLAERVRPGDEYPRGGAGAGVVATLNGLSDGLHPFLLASLR
jgi:hypothetical protein